MRSELHKEMARELAAVLKAVRKNSGHTTQLEVAKLTGLDVQTVLERAEDLVKQGLLCALDGEPWALRIEALTIPIWDDWK